MLEKQKLLNAAGEGFKKSEKMLIWIKKIVDIQIPINKIDAC